MRVSINQYGRHYDLDGGEGNDWVTYHINLNNRFDEWEILEYIKEKYPVHKTILDIGGNYGNHSMFFSEFLEHEAIHTFEPQPNMFKALTNNLTGRVTLHNVALGDHEDMASFIFMAGNAGGTKVISDPNGTIPVKTVDSYGFKDVTMMKLDVEDYEIKVLNGAKATIEKYHPVIFAECHMGFEKPVQDFLASLGYTECPTLRGPKYSYIMVREFVYDHK